MKGNNVVAAIQTTGTAFQINNAKLYVPVVTLSINDNIKLLGTNTDLKNNTSKK